MWERGQRRERQKVFATISANETVAAAVVAAKRRFRCEVTKKKRNSGPDANHAMTTSRGACSQSLGMTTESVVKTKCNPGPKRYTVGASMPGPPFLFLDQSIITERLACPGTERGKREKKLLLMCVARGLGQGGRPFESREREREVDGGSS